MLSYVLKYSWIFIGRFLVVLKCCTLNSVSKLLLTYHKLYLCVYLC